jgi:succinate dehydrogenase flavin-adding protein (antitoxin of CptAB toxin-antitoxin module)
VGYTSFVDGFVPARANLFDEVRKDPQAVCNRLMNNEDWELAGWVMNNFVQLPHAAKPA